MSVPTSHGGLLYVGHRFETIRKLVAKVDAKTRRECDASADLQAVLAQCVQTTGEAASSVSVAFRERHSEISWHRIIGMRYRIVHDYLNSDIGSLWELANRNTPQRVVWLSVMIEGKD